MLASLQPLAPELLWILCSGFFIAFLLAFSVGANDVSNSFGTSVGSRVLTVTQACILATFFEVAGATLLGYPVCDTFRKNIYDVEQYRDSQKELMLGALACLIGSASWNVIATALKMPISGTHSIVGATIGFSIVLRGLDSIKWILLLKIVGSWFASPVLAGFISSVIYLLISKTVIRKIDPLKYGLKALPLFYGATIFINVASVLIGGPDILGLDVLSGTFISLVVSGIVISIVALKLVPKLRKQITDEIITKTVNTKRRKSPSNGAQKLELSGDGNKSTTTAFDNAAFKPDSSKGASDSKAPAKPKRELTLSPKELLAESSESALAKPPIAAKPAFLLKRQQAQESQQLEEIDLAEKCAAKRAADIEAAGGSGDNGGSMGVNGRPGMIRGERLEVFRLFSSLQILTACFASFAHGTNDVSNAVAPLIPIWNIYATGAEDITRPTQIWILLFGGIGICTGLWAWGRAVMSTVGDGLTQLTPSKGFSIELGAAISVLTASKLGLPVSTTHCKIGSVVIVSLVSKKFCSQDNLLDMSEEEKNQNDERQTVDWRLFKNIAITWIVTVPLAAIASALVMLVLQWFAL